MFTGAGVRALSVSTSPPDAVFVVHGHLDPRCFMRLSSQRRHPQLSSGKVCSQRPCHPYRGELFLGNHSAVATCCHRLNWVDSKRDPRTPAAPWALWLLLALSCLFSRSPPALQAGVLLCLEAVYAGLHMYPIYLELNPAAPVSAGAFMQAFTNAQYFSSELFLLILVATFAPIRQSLPSGLIYVHIGFHILYLGLSSTVPSWCLEQNISRMQGKTDCASQPFWKRAWYLILNILGAADAAIHVLYAWILLGTARALSA